MLCHLFLSLLTPLTHSVLRSPGEVTAHGTCGCGQSGPRDRSPALCYGRMYHQHPDIRPKSYLYETLVQWYVPMPQGYIAPYTSV
jgi:hypothetical protein